MDLVAQFAIDLLDAKIESTKRALPGNKSVTLNADSICMDLERIKAQIQAKDADPAYQATQLA